MATTPNLLIDKPIVGADADMWGDKLNAAFDLLDLKVLDQTLLAAGVVTFLRTPTSANLAAAVTNETGTGALVFGTSPAIETPTVTSPVITGGSVNNTPIGGTTPAAGAFTSLSATGTTTTTAATFGTKAISTKGSETRVAALGSVTGAVSIDLATANIFAATLTGNITVSFANAPAANQSQVSFLRLTNAGAFTITWPAGTKYSNGSPPTLTAAGSDLVSVFYDPTTATYVVGIVFSDFK